MLYSDSGDTPRAEREGGLLSEGSGRSPRTQPWHVPKLPEDALDGDVPSAVVEAARHALVARRAEAAILDLMEERLDPRSGAWYYRFSNGSLVVELQVVRTNDGCTLTVECPRCPSAAVEVMHGGETRRVVLDESGGAKQLPVEGPLLGVFVRPASGEPPAQTSWVRIG